MTSSAVSVIIPTYNRLDSLLGLLESLEHQSMPPSEFEVIVVDDGSSFDPAMVAQKHYAFPLTFLRQQNQGATVARNYGARHGKGNVLVFIDDDVRVSEKTLEALNNACTQLPGRIAVGKLMACNINKGSAFTMLAIEEVNKYIDLEANQDIVVGFETCNTQLLAVKQRDFFELGMLRDPTGGWPNWDDVDFGFRAHQAGFQLVRVANAIGEHWDYSLSSLESATRRWYRASKSAVRLFQCYPNLRQFIPMYSDMSPVNWRNDGPRLILRKLLRNFLSWGLVVAVMRWMARLLEAYYPSITLLRPLYRWIEGSYKYQGYRSGLREYGKVPNADPVASLDFIR